MPAKRKRSSTARAPSEEASPPVDDVDMDVEYAPQSDCPYKIEYRSMKFPVPVNPRAKKTKRSHKSTSTGPPPAQDLDKTPPDDNTVYHVVANKGLPPWESLKKYRNFVVGTENFSLNEYIFVNHESIPHGADVDNLDDKKFWVARVLEIRAQDEAHVYLRVYWMYWPEELPGGRSDYHGVKELVASNHMEIVDAMTVSGRASVKHWLELDEEEELPDLFWRQKFDFPTQSLMEVREHCKCHQYYNPDKIMLGCPQCKIWLHEECVIDDIKRKVIERGRPADARDVESAPTDAAVDAEMKDGDIKDVKSTVVEGTKAQETKVEPSSEVSTPSRGKRAGAKSLLQAAINTPSTTSADVKDASSPGTPGTPAKAASAKSTPAKATPAKSTPAKATLANGKSATKPKKKSLAAIRQEMEQIDIRIKVVADGPTIAYITDRRGVKKEEAEDNEEKEAEERVNGHATSESSWIEDVRCLLCDGLIK